MKKCIKITILIIALMILLTPVTLRYKDGGSIRYKAILYDIMKYHQLDIDPDNGYHDGWEIKILGIAIYNSYK